MDVILLDKVDNLGGLGELVSVKPGYGRNYLIPEGKAIAATDENRAEFEAKRAKLEKAAAEALATAQARSEALAKSVVSIARQAGEEGKLFGSVGTADVADAFTETGIELQKHEVRLPDGPLRHTGEFEIDVHLHPEVNVTVKVGIVAEE